MYRILTIPTATLLILGLIACSSQTPADRCNGQVVINEFVPSNASVLADDDGDFEDWIELYNCTDSAVDLSGWGLSDNLNRPFKWVFEDTQIQPNEYLIIWASGKDRKQQDLPLHTNFKISASGEPLLLSRPSGEMVDQIDAVVVPTDKSYGRYPDGNASLYYFDQPTPSQQNLQPTALEILSPPVFSKPSGFYEQAFNLTISHSDPDVNIYYTLDGSIPDPENLKGSTYLYKNEYPENPDDPTGEFMGASYQTHMYSWPLQIQNRNHEPDRLSQISTTFHANPIYIPNKPNLKGQSIRARALKKNFLPSEVVTNTYFVFSRNIINLPIINITIPEKRLFDFYEGFIVAGIDMLSWRERNPNLLQRHCVPSNWTRRGDDTLAYFEFFNLNKELNHHYIDFRVHGNCSRDQPNKSFRITARRDSKRNFFDYKVFNRHDLISHRSLILRNSGNDSGVTMFRDAAAQAIGSDLLFNTQAYRPVVLFINAEYYGIYNIRERYDDQYFKIKYGFSPDQINILSNNFYQKKGSVDNWFNIVESLSNKNLNDPDSFDFIDKVIDVNNFIDYAIFNIYINNDDWPNNNVIAWSFSSGDIFFDNGYNDGRWRWLMFDADAGLGLNGNYNTNTLLNLESHSFNMGNDFPMNTLFLLPKLFENNEFNSRFISRFADLLNTNFTSSRALFIIDQLKNEIESEIPRHIQRWQRPLNLEAWHENVNIMKNFVSNRPEALRKHISEYFKIQGEYIIELNAADSSSGKIKINSVIIDFEKLDSAGLHDYPWVGVYFKGIPIELEAMANPGFEFSHWIGVESSDKFLRLNMSLHAKITAVFVKSD